MGSHFGNKEQFIGKQTGPLRREKLSSGVFGAGRLEESEQVPEREKERLRKRGNR